MRKDFFADTVSVTSVSSGDRFTGIFLHVYAKKL